MKTSTSHLKKAILSSFTSFFCLCAIELLRATIVIPWKDASGCETQHLSKKDVCGWIIDGTKNYLSYRVRTMSNTLTAMPLAACVRFYIPWTITFIYGLTPSSFIHHSWCYVWEVKNCRSNFWKHRYGSIYYNGRERGLMLPGLEVDTYDTGCNWVNDRRHRPAIC